MARWPCWESFTQSWVTSVLPYCFLKDLPLPFIRLVMLKGKKLPASVVECYWTEGLGYLPGCCPRQTGCCGEELLVFITITTVWGAVIANQHQAAQSSFSSTLTSLLSSMVWQPPQHIPQCLDSAVFWSSSRQSMEMLWPWTGEQLESGTLEKSLTM